MTNAYGVKQNGKILVRTISDSERAAKINYIVAEKGIYVSSAFTDNAINAMWIDYTQFTDTKLVALTVFEAAEQPA